MSTTEPFTPTASGPPTLGDEVAEVLPLVDTVFVAGPPVLLVWAGTVLFALMLAGPFALLVTFVVVLVAAAALVALAGAILATPYLLIRHFRPRLAKRRHVSEALGTDRHRRGSEGSTMIASLVSTAGSAARRRSQPLPSNHALVEGDAEAVDQFVARVLRRAHQTRGGPQRAERGARDPRCGAAVR